MRVVTRSGCAFCCQIRAMLFPPASAARFRCLMRGPRSETAPSPGVRHSDHGGGMSESAGPNGGGGPSASAQQPEVQWDYQRAVNHICNVANSEAGPDDIVLNFGASEQGNEARGEVAVRMQRRITLRPLTARALRDMLRDVIADIDADRPRGQS